MKNKPLTWFKNQSHNALEIKLFSSFDDSVPVRTKKIQDQEIIQQLVSMIKGLPTEGDMFKSFDEGTQRLVIDFLSSDSIDTVEFFRGLIKTPATSVLSSSNSEQTKIFEVAKKLLD